MKRLFFFLLLSVIVGILFETYIDTESVEPMLEAQKLQREIEALKSSNSILEQEVLKESSLTVIAERAEKLGFKEGRFILLE